MTTPKISVITVSNRPGGVDMAWASLQRQTFDDFEWVYCDTLYEKRKVVLQEYTKNDPRVVHIQQSNKDNTAVTWLSHAQNEGIRKAKGELFVFLHDYIYIEPDALEKFWFQYKYNPKIFVSGVGHQYKKPGFEDIIDKNGMITIFKEPFKKKPEEEIWYDPRIQICDKGTFHKCPPQDWEANHAMCPRQIMYDVGGFPEDYDYVGFGWDCVDVSLRAFISGYLPYIDQTNQSFGLCHRKLFPSEKQSTDGSILFEDATKIIEYHEQKMRTIYRGEIPIKYDYLTEHGKKV